MVKGDANFLIEVRAEKGDLGIALTEVVQHDELSIHLHPHVNSLGGSAVAKKKETALGRESTSLSLPC